MKGDIATPSIVVILQTETAEVILLVSCFDDGVIEGHDIRCCHCHVRSTQELRGHGAWKSYGATIFFTFSSSTLLSLPSFRWPFLSGFRAFAIDRRNLSLSSAFS